MKKGIIIGAAIAVLIIIGCGGLIAMRAISSNGDSDAIVEDDTTTDGITLREREQTPTGIQPLGEDETLEENEGGVYPPRSDYGPDRANDKNQVPIDDIEIPEPVIPEDNPRDSQILAGSVTYDDIPDASMIEGGYGTDDIKEEMIRYLEKEYPDAVITKIDLIGNGEAQSQDTGEDTSYINYIVIMNTGRRIGISLTCSESEVPFVTETNYLVINQNLLYKVAEDEYVQMTITE
jgi:hypothetical protein